MQVADPGSRSVVSFRNTFIQDVDRIRSAVAHVTGQKYLDRLTRALTEVLGVAYAFVAERTGDDPDRVRTLAVAFGGGSAPELQYALAGTPCNDVIDEGSRRVERDAQALYPQDDLLGRLRIVSYVGVLLSIGGCSTCGWLAVMDTQPRGDTHRLESVLRALGARTSLELALMAMPRDAGPGDQEDDSVHTRFTGSSD